MFAEALDGGLEFGPAALELGFFGLELFDLLDEPSDVVFACCDFGLRGLSPFGEGGEFVVVVFSVGGDGLEVGREAAERPTSSSSPTPTSSRQESRSSRDHQGKRARNSASSPEAKSP